MSILSRKYFYLKLCSCFNRQKKTDTGSVVLEFIKMSEEQKNEVAIIPAGNYVSIMGCRFTLLEDTKVEADQVNLDRILKDQEDFNKGVGVVGEHPTNKLAQGAKSAMHVSASIKTVDWRL